MSWSDSLDDGDPRHVSASLDRLARSIGAPAASTLEAVFSRWEEAVGPSVACHVRPHSLEEGTLVVTADHPGWATEVRLLEERLLQRLGEIGCENVARIEVRIQRRSV